MKTKTITAFYCDHCEKRTFSKGSMTRHEKFCHANPANYHRCLNVNGGHCGNLEVIPTEIEFHPYNDEYTVTKTVNKYHCKALDKMLHSFKAISKGLLRKYPAQFIGSEIMPLKCDSVKIWNQL